MNIKKNVIEEIIEEIISALPKLLKIGGNNLQRVKSELHDQMKGLVEDFDYDLSPALHPLEFSFLSPSHKRNPIEHRQTLVAKEILDKGAEEKKPCYVIAETGEWLLKNSVSPSDKLNKVIHIIVSDFRNDPEDSLHRAISENVYNQLEERFGPDKIGLLNWHLNKHHGTFSSKRCIYFYKEGKSPTLQPVELTDPSDTERMMKLCEYLWQQCNFLSKERGQNPKRC